MRWTGCVPWGPAGPTPSPAHGRGSLASRVIRPSRRGSQRGSSDRNTGPERGTWAPIPLPGRSEAMDAGHTGSRMVDPNSRRPDAGLGPRMRKLGRVGAQGTKRIRTGPGPNPNSGPRIGVLASRLGPRNKVLASRLGPRNKVLASRLGPRNKVLALRLGPPNKVLASRLGPRNKVLASRLGPEHGTLLRPEASAKRGDCRCRRWTAFSARARSLSSAPASPPTGRGASSRTSGCTSSLVPCTW